MNRYEQRRRRVLDQLQFGEMMVLYSGESVACSMDEGFDFEANHHFFYLTGLRRENMALVLANTHCPAHVILFIEEPIPDMERWTGRRVTIDEARAEVASLFGKSVSVRQNRGRNRIKYYKGVVSEIHDNVFVIALQGDLFDRLSCSYVDVVCGEIRMKPREE